MIHPAKITKPSVVAHAPKCKMAQDCANLIVQKLIRFIDLQVLQVDTEIKGEKRKNDSAMPPGHCAELA